MLEFLLLGHETFDSPDVFRSLGQLPEMMKSTLRTHCKNCTNLQAALQKNSINHKHSSTFYRTWAAPTIRLILPWRNWPRWMLCWSKAPIPHRHMISSQGLLLMTIILKVLLRGADFSACTYMPNILGKILLWPKTKTRSLKHLKSLNFIINPLEKFWNSSVLPKNLLRGPDFSAYTRHYFDRKRKLVA